MLTAPEDFIAVKEQLESFAPESAEVTMRASTNVELDADDAAKMMRLLEALEDLDDVQEVYSNADISEETLAALT